MVNRGAGTGPEGHCLVRAARAEVGSCIVREGSQGWVLFVNLSSEQTDTHNRKHDLSRLCWQVVIT